MSHINTGKSVFTFYFKNGLACSVLRQKEQKKQNATEIVLRPQD